MGSDGDARAIGCPEFKSLVAPRSGSAVRDTGAGIGAQYLPRVFDRFRRGDGDGRRGTGLGLGLDIAKGIVEARRGQI